ncbi:hypothetical protein NPIL_101281 [Nephila pilipes]|uniref:Uncharacterized protein n=1 Tax=Nephila pilipes TaxID=299642 RepID=A0A8X6NS12_NEPPI|nr:hypothetical protein NPIL_101281 [Nephila pilipes]
MAQEDKNHFFPRFISIKNISKQDFCIFVTDSPMRKNTRWTGLTVQHKKSKNASRRAAQIRPSFVRTWGGPEDGLPRQRRLIRVNTHCCRLPGGSSKNGMLGVQGDC